MNNYLATVEPQSLVKVDAFLNFVDDLADQLARLHVVVGVFEDAANYGGAFVAGDFEVLQAREEYAVDKVFQFVAGDAFGVGCPGPPAHAVGYRAFVVVVEEFPLAFAVVVDFEKQHPD